ncbi:hypothetical protein LINPERHAP1_LOCUS4217, partial [Linum perenne]
NEAAEFPSGPLNHRNRVDWYVSEDKESEVNGFFCMYQRKVVSNPFHSL